MTAPERPDDPWTEVLAAWAVAVALIWAAWRFLPGDAPRLASAAIWLAIPVALHLARRRSFEAEGLAYNRPLRSLGRVLAYAAVFLPLYTIGFFAVFGRAGWEIPGPDVLLTAFVASLFYAALPEEVFFRGLVQPRLATLYPEPPRRVAGIPLSKPIVIAAALFALTHAAFLPNPFSLAGLERLTTFFPGLLFGALREDTGDVVAPALFHSLCNAWLSTLQLGYMP